MQRLTADSIKVAKLWWAEYGEDGRIQNTKKYFHSPNGRTKIYGKKMKDMKNDRPRRILKCVTVGKLRRIETDRVQS